ncbi:hypothetical protein NP233_g9200 [Leucocoprinus birnbaumii]|uniref:Uncharacterized protein n=1 Tax=Leucocoprinus birnbaumii TaxID=56174 RepID=A0AAD5VKV8_9AGAR|nr:hypothetical protein NP233_g9200 [Leucocoprinus birnbaumii]
MAAVDPIDSYAFISIGLATSSYFLSLGHWYRADWFIALHHLPKKHGRGRKHQNNLNYYHNAALRRRRDLGPRQVRPAATATPVVKPPVRPVPTRTVVKPTVAPVKPTVTPTPVKPTVVAPTKPVVPVPATTSSLPPPPSLSTPVASVVPPTTSLPSTSTTPSPSPSTASRALPSPATSTTSTASPSSTTSPATSGGVSTGAVVGGIIGGFVVLGLIGAAVFLFLRRAKEKKERNEKAFDASKFRQSAVMLEDPAEKRSKPRPPTMIEQLAQHRPSPAPSSYPPSGNPGYRPEQARYASPYGSAAPPAPYGPTYPGAAYGAQAAYGQYSLPQNAYVAYGHHHGYPPQPQYQYGAQQYGAYASSVPSSTTQPSVSGAGQDNLVLPNPFASLPSPVSETVPTHYSSNASSTSTTRDLTHSAQNSTEAADAPPAYEPTSKFADYKADKKPKPAPSVSNAASSSSGAATSTSQSPINASDPAPSAESPALLSATGPLARARTGDKALPSRPLSGTSAITTVYDANDAYGGM